MNPYDYNRGFNPYLLRQEFAATRPTSHAVITGVVDKPMDEVIEELWEKDPDGYACLSEHIDLDRYRDPRKAGR
jgi:hypothetical protein